MTTTKKRGSVGGTKASRKNDRISGLPDDILGTIISLLPTKDGARTQAIARRWRPLWRSAPLNLHVDYSLCQDGSKRCSIVSKILSNHLAPTRRFYFNDVLRHECAHLYKEVKRYTEDPAAQIESWLCSGALANLEELDISFGILKCTRKTCFRPLPPCVLRQCASTVVVARIGFCSIGKEMPPWPCFPFLKQLTLRFVSISEDVFLGMLSSCHALESLYICKFYDVGCLRVSSPSLRSLGIGRLYLEKEEELIIEDTPFLERLLLCSREVKGVIRIIRAPKLEIFGPLWCCISRIEIESLVFQVVLAS
jgi:hypothetical protein